MESNLVRILSKTTVFDICKLYVFIRTDTPGSIYVMLTDTFIFQNEESFFVNCDTVTILDKIYMDYHPDMSEDELELVELRINELIDSVKNDYIKSQLTYTTRKEG